MSSKERGQPDPINHKEKQMTDQERHELAFEILQDAEVMHEFDDCLWVAIDKELYLQLQGEANAADKP